MPRERFGEYLLREGALSREAISVIIDDQRLSREAFGCVSVRREYLTEDQMIDHLSGFLGLPVLEEDKIIPNPEITGKVPRKLALKLGVLPLGLGEQGELVCACSGPVNMAALQSVSRLVNRPVKLQLVSRPRLETMQSELYSRLFDTSIRASQVVAGSGDDDLHVVTELLEKLMLRAINMDASDIHIEPGKQDLTIRFRVDGVLVKEEVLPLKLADKIASRIKVLSGLDIAEKRLPQDGSFFFQPQRLDLEITGVNLRVSTLPVIWGEKVVMRILPVTDVAVSIKTIGMEEETMITFKKHLASSYGIILVTGPTGSGKSTTLYSALQMIRSETVNITTLEDPVEMKMAGINQTQINPGPKVTFAGALRSILRQDPDIIMVGEIRDSDTVRVSLQAAITGHLVLSTLHTNDAPSAFTRMMDMGAESFLTATSVRGILAQRLLRRVCPHCRQKTRISPAEQKMLKIPEDEVFEVSRGQGCEKCNYRGYRGRIGVFELLDVNSDLQRIVAAEKSTDDIRRFARENMGFRTLHDDGVIKLKHGIISPEELMRMSMD